MAQPEQSKAAQEDSRAQASGTTPPANARPEASDSRTGADTGQRGQEVSSWTPGSAPIGSDDPLAPPRHPDELPDEPKPPVTEIAGQYLFRIEGKALGEGGMGVVWPAQDMHLERAVAVKIAKSSVQRARFEQEAAITARLEHPGIVPVVARGVCGDKPYYAMRYLEGQRFDEAIAQFHREVRHRHDFIQPDKQLKFRELLQRFVQVCRTIAYAHSKGVIHRDIKPNNIILGRYGETIVLDWGLARWRRKADAVSHESDRVDELLSAGGKRIGTPAYWSPEQRAGQPADERTDVFLLGATLYHLLTGQAPFANRQQPRPIRELKPWVPPALAAICQLAMRERPEERYPSAEALAQDVEKWLADEAVSAYREPLGGRLARWARHHRALASGLLAVALAAGAFLVIFTVVVGAKNQQLAQSNLDLTAALSREEKERQRAEKNASLAEQRRQDAEQARELAERRRALAERATERARNVIELIASEAALDQLSRKKELTPQEKQLLQALVPYYEQYAREAADSPEEKHRQAGAYSNLGRILYILGRYQPSESAYRQALTIREKLVADHPQVPQYRQELATTHNNLGVLLQQQGKTKEAESAYRQALQLYQKLVADHPQVPEYRQELATTHNNLGNLLQQQGKAEEAESAYRQALQLYQKLVADYPQVPQYRQELAKTHDNLGFLLLGLEKAGESEQHLRQAVGILRTLAQQFPQHWEYRLGLARSILGLGFCQALKGNAEEARSLLGEAKSILQALLKENPSSAEAQSLLKLVEKVLRALEGK